MSEQAEMPESLSGYVNALDARMIQLEGLVKALQVIENKLQEQLHGPNPSEGAKEDNAKHTPSLQSIKLDFDMRLKELDQIVQLMSQCVDSGGPAKD